MKDQRDHANERRFLFLCASARREGNSVMLARAAAASLPSTTEQHWLHLADLNLPPFEDLRHEEGRSYLGPKAGAEVALKATLSATDLVFVTPLYWYGLPAIAKLYLDHWSGWMRVPELEFRDQMAGKRLGAIVVLSDVPTKADPLLASLRLTADYMQMTWSGELVGHGNRPGDIMDDVKGMNRAPSFLQEVPVEPGRAGLAPAFEAEKGVPSTSAAWISST